MENINFSPVSVKAKGDYTSLVQAVANMINSANKGCCKISNALLGKYIASKERDVSLIEAQTKRDKENILAGIKTLDSEIMELNDSAEVKQLPLLVGRINQSEDNMRLFKAVAETVKELESTPAEEISDEPLSQGFFNRWRKEAELIDDDELRQLWSHLLAEEVKKPKTISVRSLDVVKNLSKEEANIFQKLAKNCINGQCFALYKDSTPIIGTLEEIIILQESGILGAGSKLIMRYRKPHEEESFLLSLAGYSYVLICKDEKIEFRVCPLTKAGKELLKIASVSYTKEEAISIAKAISGQNPQSDLILYEVTGLTINPDGSSNLNFNEQEPLWKKEIVNKANN